MAYRSTVTTTSVTSLYLASLNATNWGLDATIVGSDATATTYSLACGSLSPSNLAIPSPVCFLPSPLHLTVGPSTVQFTATGNLTDASPIVTSVTTSASCTLTRTSIAFADSTSTGAVVTCSAATVDSSGRRPVAHEWQGTFAYQPVTVTAAVEVTPTPTSATSTSKAGAPGAGSSELTGMASLLAVVAVILGFL